MKKNLKNLPFFSFIFLFCFFVTIAKSEKVKNNIVIFAAASLYDSLTEVISNFNKLDSQKVVVSYAGTSKLSMQIKSGAPADIFISASKNWMDYLENRNLINSREILLTNKLVLISANENIKIEGLDDLDFIPILDNTKKRIAVAMVNSVPAGIYTKQFLQNTGTWDRFKTNLAQVDNVRSALSLVGRKEVDYGFVYYSDAIADKRVKVLLSMTNRYHEDIVYPIAMINSESSEKLNSIQKVYKYLLSQEAKNVFNKWGFNL